MRKPVFPEFLPNQITIYNWLDLTMVRLVDNLVFGRETCNISQ